MLKKTLIQKATELNHSNTKLCGTFTPRQAPSVTWPTFVCYVIIIIFGSKSQEYHSCYWRVVSTSQRGHRPGPPRGSVWNVFLLQDVVAISRCLPPPSNALRAPDGKQQLGCHGRVREEVVVGWNRHKGRGDHFPSEPPSVQGVDGGDGGRD